MRNLIPLGLAAIAAGCAATPDIQPATQTVAAPSVEQLVIARQAGMHMAATLLLTDIRRVVEAGEDVRRHVHEPDGIARWGEAIAGLFPAGSQGGRARPEIWSNRDDFARKAADLAAAATRMSQLAEAGDAPGYAAQARVVQAACSACHSAYRR